MVLIQFGNSELGITMSGLVVFILAMVYKYLILVDPKVNSEINKLKEVIASRDLEIDNLKNQLSDKLAPQPLKGNTKELLEQVALLQNYIRSME
jgi:cell division protein FtsL